MSRKNEVLDRISSVEDEVVRLRDRIPVDNNPTFDLYLKIIGNILERLEYVTNLVELEEED